MILNNCETSRLVNTKIINSSEFKNSIAKYNSPLLTIKSNSKIYEKPKKCINDLIDIIF